MKRAFDHAYVVLTNAVSPLSVARDCSRISLLGRVLRVTDEVVRYRRWVEQQFCYLHRRSPPPLPLHQFPARAPRSLSNSRSTSSVESGGSSEVSAELFTKSLGRSKLIYCLLFCVYFRLPNRLRATSPQTTTCIYPLKGSQRENITKCGTTRYLKKT